MHFRAGNGVNGQGRSKGGARGEDMEIVVPPGTVVRRKPELPGGGERARGRVREWRSWCATA